MKQYILFPFIALIFLCGCKSNSFTTQRYTHLSHTHAKYPDNKEPAAQKRSAKPSTVKADEALAVSVEPIEESHATSMVTPVERSASGEIKTSAFPKRLIDPLVNTGSKTFSSLTSEVKKQSAESVAKNKTFKEKVKNAAGLFNTLFKIILFAIILAILVAIIIIIILT